MLLAAARRSCSRALALPGTETSAGVLSLVAVRLPGSPLGGVLMAGAVHHVPPAAQFRRALSPLAARSPACSGAAGRPEKLLRRASPSFLRRARVAATGGLAVARLLCSTALPFPALPLNSPAHRSSSQPQQHRQQAPADSPKEEKHLGTPCRPVAAGAAPRRESRVVVVAVPPRGPRQLGGTPAPHRLCRLFPCAGVCGPVRSPLHAKSIFRVPNHSSTKRN